jgi:low affinity Fe/Cu permease
MKKLRLIIRVVTGFLVALTVAGIVILIVNDRLNLLDTSYEIIAFSLGASGMIMAVVVQVDSYQQEKAMKKMIEDLTRLNREADEDDRVDRRFQRKIDKILDINQQIYQRLGEDSKE